MTDEEWIRETEEIIHDAELELASHVRLAAEHQTSVGFLTDRLRGYREIVAMYRTKHHLEEK